MWWHTRRNQISSFGKRTSPFKSAGVSVQSTAGSRGVRISVSNAGYTTFRGSVRILATNFIRQFPLHFPSRASPCAITFQLDSTTDGGVQLKLDGTRWSMGGEVKGKLANGVGSQSPSHCFTLPRYLVYPALLPLMRTPRLPVVDWTDTPDDLNGLVRFAERPNLVPSHFKRTLQSLST